MKKPLLLIIVTRSGLVIAAILTILSALLPPAIVHITAASDYNGLIHGKTVVIDPGHGGVDGGTGHGKDILEKNINLAIGLKLQQELQNQGASVIMTRDTDKSLDDHIKNGSRQMEDLNARVGIINHADVFISLHTNSSQNAVKTKGPLVFYYSKSENSKILAESIQKNLNALSAYKDRGIILDTCPIGRNFYILRKAAPPGVIVEVGYVTNALDREVLLSDLHQAEIAKRIAESVLEYLDN